MNRRIIALMVVSLLSGCTVQTDGRRNGVQYSCTTRQFLLPGFVHNSVTCVDTATGQVIDTPENLYNF